MAANNEVDIAFQWIQSTLTGDSTLQGEAPGGVWRADAPAGTAGVYIAVTHQSSQGRDGTVFGGGRAFSEVYFEIVAAGPATSAQTIASAAARIDTLLTVAQQTAITGGTLISSFRTQPLEADPLINGVIMNNNGGLYKIVVKAA